MIVFTVFRCGPYDRMERLESFPTITMAKMHARALITENKMHREYIQKEYPKIDIDIFEPKYTYYIIKEHLEVETILDYEEE